MRFWDKSLRIFKCLCANGKQSVRHIAQQTGLSKSSVHRLKQAMERRDYHPESWFWETEEGRRWFIRLVVADRTGTVEAVAWSFLSVFTWRCMWAVRLAPYEV